MSAHDDDGGSGCEGCSHGLARRAFLHGGARGVLALAMIPACGNPTVSPPSGPVEGGNLADLPVGTLRVIGGEGVVIGRDAQGVYAMSASCTHAGCLLAAAGGGPAAGLSCSCHGSRFDENGAVTRGPAATPLPHYRVDVASDGTLTIQGAAPVAADARTPANS
jgi:Rieske Fe-S protein